MLWSIFKALFIYFFPGIKKKVTALSNKRDCEDVRPWIKSICNHLYWCALSSKGNAAVVVAKWSSLAAHVRNIHEHDDENFPTCSHPPIDNADAQKKKKWLKPSMHFVYFVLLVVKCIDISQSLLSELNMVSSPAPLCFFNIYSMV